MKDHARVIRKRLSEIEKEQDELRKERDDMRRAGQHLLHYLYLLGKGETPDKQVVKDIRWAQKQIGRF